MDTHNVENIYDALMRLKIDSFSQWMHDNGESLALNEFLESAELKSLIGQRNLHNMSVVVDKFTQVFTLWEHFEDLIHKGDFGPMAQFWQSFLDMVQTLLDYVKSTRTGDWELHLSSMEKMLVWFHAYDRPNYSRDFTYCWIEQTKLHINHPEIHEFVKGNFVVKRSPGNFNMLPPDEVIEQIMNRDQKGHGGIVGYSTSADTVQRWC